MDSTLSVVACSLRMLIFVGTLSLLPGKLIPLTVRLGFFVCLMIFVLPIVPGFSYLTLEQGIDFFQSQKTLEHGLAALGYAVVTVEILIGFSLAIAAGLGAYSARLASSWLTMVVWHRATSTMDIEEGLNISSSKQDAINVLFYLLVMCVLFCSPVAPSLWLFAGHSIVLLPSVQLMAGTSSTLSATVLFQIITDVGSASFSAAFLMALPAFIAALCIDVSCLPWRRYLNSAFSEQLAGAAKVVAVVIILAVGVYYFTGAIASLINSSLSGDKAEQFLQQISRIPQVSRMP